MAALDIENIGAEMITAALIAVTEHDPQPMTDLCAQLDATPEPAKSILVGETVRQMAVATGSILSAWAEQMGATPMALWATVAAALAAQNE